MNRLRIMEIKQRRHEDRRQKALVNAALRSPIGHPITYILDKRNRLMHHAYSRHNRNAESGFQVNRGERVSLTLLPTGYKASKIVYNDGLSSKEVPEFSQANFPILPQQPPGPLLPHRKRPCTGGEIPAQSLTDSEKRDRLYIGAVEIISEWTTEEPNFVDPEAAYGDKSFRFMDSVKVRLRAFKATISPDMMQILENASMSCKQTPQCDIETEGNNGDTDKTNLTFEHHTPASRSQPKARSEIIPRESPFFRTPSTRHSGNSRPGTQFVSGNNDDHLPRTSPAVMRVERTSVTEPVPQPRQSYPREKQIMEGTASARCFEEEPGCSRRIYPDSNGQSGYINPNFWGSSPRFRCNFRNYDVDLDTLPIPRWPPYRGLDIEEPESIPLRISKPERSEEKNDDISLTASLLHPIWDTPEECKPRWLNFMLLE